MKITNKKILITGGATGIGFALVERFINDGNSVIICGRREKVLNEAKNKFPSLVIKVCDLAIESERELLFKWISETHNDLDILVNNAGIQHWMSISDSDFFQRAKEEIAINIEAPVHLTYLFQNLKSLSIIINVTSALSFVPRVKVPIYSGTKAFFHSFTLSLRHVLKEKNIKVIEIIPPALNTDLGGKGMHDFAPPVSEFIEAVFEQMEAGSDELTYGFSEQVSNAGAEILKASFDSMNKV